MSRAVVFGGGGPVGMAWESGLVAGLARQGIDLAVADRVVGTSAGAVVGARLAAQRPMSRPDVLAVRSSSRSDSSETSRTTPPPSRFEAMMQARAEAQAFDGTPEEARAILGRFALAQDNAPEESFLRGFADLAEFAWPAVFECTGVNASSGEFVVFDASRGVDLQRAVAASCSVPGIFPPITVDGDRYIDGGMRSPLNADIVAGSRVVLVVSVIAIELLGPAIPDELEAVRHAGAALEVVDGGQELLDLADGGIGLMDVAKAPAAFDLGLTHAGGAMERVAALWGYEGVLPKD